MFDFGRFLQWADKRPKICAIAALAGKLFVFNHALILCALPLAYVIGLLFGDGTPTSTESFAHEVDQLYAKGGVRLLVVVLLSVAFFEELAFRFIPLSIVLILVYFRPSWRWTIVPMMFIASLTFGLVHVSNFDTITVQAISSTVLIQGGAGVLFCVLFLKCTGLRPHYVLHALLVTVVAHALWNGYLMGVVEPVMSLLRS